MKRLVYLLIVCSFLIICRHQISRSGYDVDTKSPSYAVCNIAIKKFETVPDSVATRIGKVNLSDFGFSKHCSGEDAIVILRKGGLRFKC